MNGKWRGISGCGSTRKKSRKRHIRIAGTSGTQISRCSSSQQIYMQLSRIPRMRNQGKFENKGQSLPRQDKGSHHWDIMAATERAGALRHQLRQTVDKYSERWDRMERQKITIMVSSWRVQQDIQSQNIFPKDNTRYDKNSISRFPCPLSPQGTLTRHRSWCLQAGKSIWTHAKWCFWVCEHEIGIVSECSQFWFKIDLHNHSIVEVGRHLGKSSSWAHCSKQSQLRQVAQAYGQLGFECFQGWRLHNSSVWCGPVFDHHHSKRVFSYV